MKLDPAFGDNFFDREAITATLIKRVEAFTEGYHQNIGILGKPYIGKSTLLQNFILTTQYPNILPIYLELQDEPFAYFGKRFMGMLLVGFFQSEGKMVPQEIEGMIKAAKRELPKTTKKMLQISQQLKRGKLEGSFNDLLSLTNDLHDETGKKIILVMDDFEKLEGFALKDPFSTLGKHIMLQKNTMYIVSSSKFKRAQEIFSEKLSLLFGNFEILEMEPFDFKTCKNFIQSKLAPHTLSRPLTHFLIRLTDGQPYYLSALLDSLRNIAWQNAADEITEGMFIEVMENELFYMEGRLSRHFNSLIAEKFPAKKDLYLNTLVAIAIGHRKCKAIGQFTSKSLEEVKKNLLKLVSEEVIKKDGNFYHLHDPLLCFWLKNVYHLRRVSLRVNKSVLNSHFRKATMEHLKLQGEEDKKEITKRVEELLLMFKNETLQLNEKRHKFPNFNQVASRTFFGRKHPIIAKSSNYRWICQVANHKVVEDDVWGFLEELKRTRMKPNQKIMIIPYGIDINAKLLAKESKISLWELKDLNYLFDLFNKPKVVIEEETVER